MISSKHHCMAGRLIGISLALIWTSSLLAADPIDSPWLMPFDVGQKYQSDPVPAQPTQEQMYEFAWESFIALQWPYLIGGKGGQPDPNAAVIPIQNGDPNDPSPMVVWETYMVPGIPFPDNPDPDNLPLWQSPDETDVTSGFKLLSAPSYHSGPGASASPAPSSPLFFPGINQPYTHANVPTGPVVDQNKNYLRYEVTINETFFNYIVHNRYFVADIQKEAVTNYLDWAYDNPTSSPPSSPESVSKPAAPYFQSVPTGVESFVPTADYAKQGLVEVKAAWRVLVTSGKNADIPERYFRRNMQIPLPGGGSETKLVGLVGFHIHRVTPHGHLPSTFEHVDNVQLVKHKGDPLPLPKTPSLNPGNPGNSGGSSTANDSDRIPIELPGSQPAYPNGYEVGGLSGQPGLIPKAFLYDGDTAPPIGERVQINVSRATPIPPEVQRVNRRYQKELKESVWRYYQLVGTQNISGTNEQNPDPALQAKINPYLGPGIPNENLGPGIPGAQFSNTTDLVNTTLESYTQPGFSCARCHINAFPVGVNTFPPFENAFSDLHVMSFILLNAKFMENTTR